MSTNQPENFAASPRTPCSPLRKAFEAWISAFPFERDITRNSNDTTKHAWPGNYREYEVQLAWDAWDAAATTIRKTLRDPAKTHVLMLRGDIAWTDAGLRHILGDSPKLLPVGLGGDLTCVEQGEPTAATDCIWHSCRDCGCQWASLTWKKMQ